MDYGDWSIQLLRLRSKLAKRGEKLIGNVWYPSGYVDNTNALPEPLQPQQPTNLQTIRLNFSLEYPGCTLANKKQKEERVFKPIVSQDICRE